YTICVNVGDMGPRASELRTIPLFQGFGDAELASVGGLFAEVDVDPAKPLFEVGETSTDLYLLTAGEVVLDRPNDDVFRLAPPALIGELGALAGLPRSTRAIVTARSTVWALPAKKIQDYLAEHQELGIRFLVNLLAVVADKVHRDQTRMGDMRQHLITTQKELKRLREVVLETVETPLSAPVHDTLDKLITSNRRVNYRISPPSSLAAQVRLESGTYEVDDISRTHVSLENVASSPAAGGWLSGVLVLAGTEVPISGRVYRVQGKRVTLELDLLIDEFAAALEGYLTRAQLLDVLV
ncbi:MAG TPA: cyclic nucleotide-binding domain-containing protein, partial [Kofleriaceae bacterium]|nr:cyclic nucleotide-binding domain-containing protein [Kofleriaceae bacterium]